MLWNAGMPRWTVAACCRRAASIGVELVVGAGEADFQSVDFAGPALAFGFADAVVQVGADLLEPGALVWVWPQERAPDAGTCS